MKQKNNQEDKIEISQRAFKECRHSPTESSCYLGDVVEMPRYPPPARSKEQTLFFLSLRGGVSGFNSDRLSSPDGALSLGVADMFLVVVRIVVDVNGRYPTEEDEEG